MRLSLSTISTLNASFGEDVDAYAAAGFDAIGLWEMKLPEDDEANRDALRTARLAVSNCIPTVPSFLQLAIPGMEGPADPEERADAICASVRRLARYEPDCVLCLSGPLGGRTEAEGREIVVDGLRRAAEAAREAGVRLAFEPIHPSQHDSAGFIGSLAEALGVLDDLALGDVGILVDTYNLVGEAPAVLGAAVGRIAGVHVADELAQPAPGVRTLPAPDGHSATLVETLRAAGWDGTLDVEIFSTSDGFWSLPVEEAARRAFASVAALRDQTEP
ncbi:sugar phosphate isomerase/epimerase family protein [Gaiella sp.]|uniref:sugar phosphate isomerase/epimerase family protein n=1 Tax=Gaiella sp. TaxID=2663207 RepID=UPI002E358DCE|nr:TIM barrel protein [Gaiella sp.]HEX5583370.1 TIM barrel protein [Gaiella sp.]